MKVITTFLFLISMTPLLIAEGSKEMLPASTDIAHLLVGGSSQTHMAAYNDVEANRLYIHINDFNNEILRFGFNSVTANVYYRIKDPNGNIVAGPTLIPTSGAGFISSYTQAVTGPQAIYGASGYLSRTFTPTMNGDYYIEFNVGNATTFSATTASIRWFDFTVHNTASNIDVKGRLFTKNWGVSTTAFTQAFYGSFYVYSTDSIVTKLDLNGFTPFIFSINCNSYGVVNTGDLENDRKSVAGYSVAPEYPLFLNDPDPNVYPASIPSVVSSTAPFVTPDCAGGYCVNATFTKNGLAEVVLNLNGVAGYQSGTTDVLLAESVVAGDNCFSWDGLDGLGNPVTVNFSIDMIITVQNGYTNFPVFDAECNQSGFIVDLVRPIGVKPALFWDDSNLPGGTVETAGCTTTCHIWGTGVCSGSSFGDQVTLNTYWYGITDTKSFSVSMSGCPPIANNDSPPAIPEDTANVSFNVAANDSDIDGDLDISTVAIITASSVGGTATADGSGNIVYTPPTSFNGNDSIIYQICDVTGSCDTATLYIVVNATNDKPVANDDAAATNEDVAVAINVLANDNDNLDLLGNIDPTSVAITSNPSNGITSVNGITGVVTYTPNADFNGIDTFSYQVCDDGFPLPAVCDTAMVIVTVNPTNDKPVANDDAAATNEDVAVAINVLANDNDNLDLLGNIDPTSVAITNSPSNGTTSVNGITGVVTYTPKRKFQRN
jgi:hypothetical protein